MASSFNARSAGQTLSESVLWLSRRFEQRAPTYHCPQDGEDDDATDEIQHAQVEAVPITDVALAAATALETVVKVIWHVSQILQKSKWRTSPLQRSRAQKLL